MTIRIRQHFQAKWSVFWATSYSFDLITFEEFWLRYLGDAPLNVTLLVDFDRYTATWREFEGAQQMPGRVNRDYLIRGVAQPGNTFHPKTYFFANAKEGVLLVGSGNLGLHGLEDGHEVFACFSSRDEPDLGTIRGWRDWMGRIVQRLDDAQVRKRWWDVQERATWLRGAATGSLFVTNWERGLLAQFVDGLGGAVDELHAMAPFFDRRAEALERLIGATAPARVCLYVGKNTNVDGEKLLSVLRGCGAELRVLGYRPDKFVHAKLLGLVRGGRGRLLSGSANLTRSALVGTAEPTTGNVEAGVLLDTDPDIVRAAFAPVGLEVYERAPAELAALTFQQSEVGQSPPLSLRSARRLPDGRVGVVFEGACDEREVFVTVGQEMQPLRGSETVGPLAPAERASLVRLTDRAGTVQSNAVPLDDPKQLDSWLRVRPEAEDRPREVDAGDLQTPVGQMLQRLHRECIFDVDETPGMARMQGATEGTEEDATFWERYAKEELGADPRSGRYPGSNQSGRTNDEDVFEVLRTMLDQTPEQRRLRAVGDEQDESRGGSGGPPWTPDRRLQVRLYNVLERWSRAIGDSRLRWIEPLAPVRNYTYLLAALKECWARGYLKEERVVSLIGTLLGSLIRTEARDGYLLSIPDEERERAVAVMPATARLVAASLVYAALRPAGRWAEYVFDWQPFLVAGRELGVIEGGEGAGQHAGEILKTNVRDRDVAERLAWAAIHIDDQHWQERIRRELEIAKVVLTTDRMGPGYGVTLEVAGVTDVLADVRLVTLVRRALEYRNVRGAVMTVTGRGRLSVRLNEPAYARIDGKPYESQRPVTRKLMEDLELSGAGWGGAMGASEAAAS